MLLHEIKEIKNGQCRTKDGALSDLFDNLGIDEDTKALIDLFSSKKKIKDHEDLHALAESLGIEPNSLEEKVYALLQSFFANGKYVATDNISIDDKELEMGDSVEREHTNSPIIARRIALDHLAEMPDYYSRLQAMEKSVATTDGGEGSGIKGHVTAKQMAAMKERRKIDGRNLSWQNIYKLIKSGKQVTGFLGHEITEKEAKEQSEREKKGKLSSQRTGKLNLPHKNTNIP